MKSKTRIQLCIWYNYYNYWRVTHPPNWWSDHWCDTDHQFHTITGILANHLSVKSISLTSLASCCILCFFTVTGCDGDDGDNDCERLLSVTGLMSSNPAAGGLLATTSCDDDDDDDALLSLVAGIMAFILSLYAERKAPICALGFFRIRTPCTSHTKADCLRLVPAPLSGEDEDSLLVAVV